jgi:hypothetical protein
MNVYKGITFAEGYNKSFAEFKEELGNTHVFNDIPSAEREAELKKAHKIAISGNGKLPTTTNESEETTAK